MEKKKQKKCALKLILRIRANYGMAWERRKPK